MAMAVDTRQQQPQFNGLGYDSMRYPPPQFTNPWVSSPATNSQHYATSLPAVSAVGDHQVSLTYGGPVPSLVAGIAPVDEMYGQQGLPFAQDLKYPTRPYGNAFPAAATTSAGFAPAPTSAPQYTGDLSSARSPYGYQSSERRSSHSSVASNGFLGDPSEVQKLRQNSLIDYSRLNAVNDGDRNSFSDALDASRGMVAMSQDITPRNIYGNQGSSRSSSDSYGFPSTHSAHSSISSASTYPSYYNSSVSEASVGDYSSASESVDMPSRTLPRPSGLMGGTMPPAPQSMMGQFSSKVASSSQKKHKCKICDKRFTRPSSLQTHMYSHTGEKPFACDVDGCGRHFSVVSNLRRHRKVHKGERDHPSPDDED